MSTYMPFHLNVLPFFDYCIVMVPVFHLHSAAFREPIFGIIVNEKLIWPIGAGFFEHAFSAVKPWKMSSFLLLSFTFFSLPVSNSKYNVLFWMKETPWFFHSCTCQNVHTSDFLHFLPLEGGEYIFCKIHIFCCRSRTFSLLFWVPWLV